jgi:DNA (cytosine-5)-methyltransferase 1
MQSVELFAGCGGLALGMSRAGFRHILMAEFDQDAVSTVLHNKAAAVDQVVEWPMTLKDVREIDWSSYPALDLISGGPPCQPFGIGGKKLGQVDRRDMWPEAIRAVREARPRAFLFENVRNLAGPKFRAYLDWIVRHLERPSLVRTSGETHESHLDRLKRASAEPEYRVTWQVVNAADYGAAQIRFRVLIFGIRADLGVAPAPMTATHSRDRLLWEQYIIGEYWDRHGLPRRTEPMLQQDKSRVAELRSRLLEPAEAPWVTVRDALVGLGEPDGFRNHTLQPGARVYPGHTGSPLDLPSKALKAGDHGVPGGENMMVRDDGSVRYFTTREAARLVGLPDEYAFPRSWTESMRQLGNAVPAPLGQAAGQWLTDILKSKQLGPSLTSRRRAA